MGQPRVDLGRPDVDLRCVMVVRALAEVVCVCVCGLARGLVDLERPGVDLVWLMVVRVVG